MKTEKFLRVSNDLDSPSEEVPEKRLIAAIMLQAIEDARLTLTAKEMKASVITDKNSLVQEAIDFLFTDRSDIYWSILDIDPAAFRESFVRSQSQRLHDVRMSYEHRDRENRKRYNFMANYELYRPTTSN